MDTASVRTSPVYSSVVINRCFIGVQRKVLSQRSGGGKDFPLRGNHHVKRFGAEIVNLFVPQSHNTVICRNRLRCDHIALHVIGKPDYTIVGDRGQRLVFIVINVKRSFAASLSTSREHGGRYFFRRIEYLHKEVLFFFLCGFFDGFHRCTDENHTFAGFRQFTYLCKGFVDDPQLFD